MKVDMVDLLMGNSAVVLQNVVVGSTCRADQLLESRLDNVNTHVDIQTFAY